MPLNPSRLLADGLTLQKVEEQLARLLTDEAAADAALVVASTATRAAPDDAAAAAHHLTCADRLAEMARDRERTEEAVLSLRRLARS